MQELGDRLSELRKDFGYTQEYIGEFLNVTRTSVSAYETGVNDPPIENLIKLADLYNVSLDYICCRTKERFNLNLNSKDHRELMLEIYKLLNDYSILKK